MKMKNVRAKMLAKDLKGVINLPNYDDNQPVEITISPAVEIKKPTPAEVDEALKSIREIMANAKKNPDFNPNKTLEEYRMERLEAKYGPLD